MSGETTVVVPKRGGIHPLYGLYIGGSGLDQDYQPKDRNSYSYHASQRRNVKTISSIERDLVTARDSATHLKFDGRLEPVVTCFLLSWNAESKNLLVKKRSIM